MTTTVSTSFTAVGQSVPLSLGAYDELLTYNISGTYAATIVIDRALTRDPNGAWETVAGPFSTDDATVAGTVYGEKNHIYRVRCTAFTSGTCVTTLADEDVIVKEVKDLDGNVISTATQAGVELPGTLDVTGDATFTGATSEAPVGADLSYGNGLATIVSLGVATKIVATTAGRGDANGFTVGTDNTLTATYTGTKLCRILARFFMDPAVGTDNITLHVYVNGASVYETAAQSVAQAAPVVFEIDILANIASGETVELYAENEDTTENIETAAFANRQHLTAQTGFMQVTSA